MRSRADSTLHPLFALLLGLLAVYAVWQLNRLNRSISFTPFIEAQTKLYSEVSLAASVIANSTDANEVAEASDRFKTLMNGPLVIYSDETASWSVALFATCMDEPENEKCKDRDLKLLATGLGRTMRMSLSETGRLGLTDFAR